MNEMQLPSREAQGILVDAILEILRGCVGSSRAIDAIRHPKYAVLKEYGMAAIPTLMRILDLDTSGAHVMTMINGLVPLGEGPVIPEAHRGVIPRMKEEFRAWWAVKSKEEGI